MKKLSLFVFFFLTSARIGFGTDCRTELGVHLKPLWANGPFSWAVEASLYDGKLDHSGLDRTFTSQMFFTGLDFTSGSHRVYAEGGLKYWGRSDDQARSVLFSTGYLPVQSVWSEFPKPAQRHWGMREAFYEFNQSATHLKIGLQSMRLGNSMLLDERVLGLGAMHESGAFDFHLKLGTVSTDFARKGDFCSTRHVYNLLRGGRFNLVSNNLWETNFFGVLASWDPSQKQPNQKRVAFEASADDDFKMDEFKQESWLKNIGLIFFEEFGSGFHDYKYYFGAIASFALPGSVTIETEMIGQYIRNENALAFKLAAKRDWAWNSGALTNVSLTLVGKYSLDDQSRFYSAFSNLYIGEVMRLDVQDLPFWSVALRHEFPVRFKPTVKVLYLQEPERDHLQELDLQLHARIYNGLRLYGIYSHIQSDLLPGITQMRRMELRWAF